jgi:hypothetical protein
LTCHTRNYSVAIKKMEKKTGKIMRNF